MYISVKQHPLKSLSLACFLTITRTHEMARRQAGRQARFAYQPEVAGVLAMRENDSEKGGGSKRDEGGRLYIYIYPSFRFYPFYSVLSVVQVCSHLSEWQ